jgi:thiazole biosynthesis enzyme
MITEVDESTITRAIVGEFMKEFLEYVESDVIVVGSGPAGIMAAKYIARSGLKTLIIERNIMMGGGMWQGGMLFPKMVVEAPAHKLLEEVGVKFKEYKKGVYVCSSPHASLKLLTAALDAGAVVFNSMEVKDVVYRKEGINGVVVNWHAVSMLPEFLTCVDPLALKSKVVIDATGHKAEVARIAREKLNLKIPFPREGAMWASEAEKATIKNTREVYPGLIVCGMASNSIGGLPRMGPLYGAMFLSGVKAAKLALKKFKKEIKLEREIERAIAL